MSDNIFPDANIDWAESQWVKKSVGDQPGDVLEFGTGTGASAAIYAGVFPDRKLFTIDHFLGLEETRKGWPPEWAKGVFAADLDATKEKLASHKNVKMIIEDIHKLSTPESYGIGEIAFCNVDVDIYEPTKAALNFLSKCSWNRVVIRFDDWHGHESAYDQHERLAAREWLDENGYKFQLACGGNSGGLIVERD